MGGGCDINNEAAVRRIFELKQRPWDKKLIVLVADINMLETCVGKVDDTHEKHGRP